VKRIGAGHYQDEIKGHTVTVSEVWRDQTGQTFTLASVERVPFNSRSTGLWCAEVAGMGAFDSLKSRKAAIAWASELIDKEAHQ
jgi:hypothetical protein